MWVWYVLNVFLIDFFSYLNCLIEQSDAINTLIIGWSDAICFAKECLTLNIINELSDAKNFHSNKLSDAKSLVWRYMFLASAFTALVEVWRYIF
jgi:hypothetical protein